MSGAKRQYCYPTESVRVIGITFVASELAGAHGDVEGMRQTKEQDAEVRKKKNKRAREKEQDEDDEKQQEKLKKYKETLRKVEEHYDRQTKDQDAEVRKKKDKRATEKEQDENDKKRQEKLKKRCQEKGVNDEEKDEDGEKTPGEGVAPGVPVFEDGKGEKTMAKPVEEMPFGVA